MKNILTHTTVFRGTTVHLCMLVLLFAGCYPSDKSASSMDPSDPLAWSIHFANALTDHPSRTGDRLDTNIMIQKQGEHVESIVRTLVKQDRLQEATDYAMIAQDWRRVNCLIMVAREYAMNENIDQAKEILTRAEAEAERISGWEKERLRANLSSVYALINNRDRMRELRRGTVDKEEMFKFSCAVAIFYAAEGEFQRGLEHLESLKGQNFYSLVMERGYTALEIARMEALRTQSDMRHKFILAAEEAAFDTGNAARFELLLKVAEAYNGAGKTEDGQRLVLEAEKMLADARLLKNVEVRFKANLAAMLDQSGLHEKAANLFEQVRQRVHNLDEHDQLAAYAVLSENLFRAGKDEEGWEVWDQGLNTVSRHINSNGRVKGMVFLLIALAENGKPVPPEKVKRIQDIYASLSDPW